MLFSLILVVVSFIVMFDFFVLGLFCLVYVSDFGDDEELVGINLNMIYLNLVDWKVFFLYFGVYVNGWIYIRGV